MPPTSSKTRLEARIPSDVHEILKRAAEIQGRTMTDFVVSAVREVAQRAIEESGVIRLTLADSKSFADKLLSPPQPAAALKRAFERRSKLLGTE